MSSPKNVVRPDDSSEVVLSPNQVEQIRELSRVPNADLKRIAKKFGVDEGHVKFIKNRKSR